MERNFDKFLQAYQSIKTDGIDMCIVTLVNARGSIPQNIGARMIVSQNQILFGTIGGGKLEAKAFEVAKDLIQNFNATNLVTWNLQKDVGMTCGGEVTLFFEPHVHKNIWEIAIFGAGHVSQELVRTMQRLDCSLTVYDNRKEWLDKLPKDTKRVYSEDLKSEVEKLSNHTFVVIMTMGHSTDLPILAEVLKTKNLPYLGVIGSKSKRNTLLKGLLELKVAEEVRENFICPMGEPFGSNSPCEIAISICAQLIKYRDLN